MREHLYGLDVCRIVAMVMITALHINNQHLGLLRSELPLGISAAGFFIEYICFAGVNCFAVISGYLLNGCDGGYDRQWLGRYLSLWLKTILWGIILSGIECFWLKKGISGETVIQIIFPITGFWWYISAYMGLLIFMPLLNRGLNRLSAKDLLIISTAMFLVLLLTLHKRSSLGLDDGYSVIWLMVCYIFGFVLKRNMPQILQVKKINLITMILFIFSVLVPMTTFFTGGNRYLWMNYTSPLCVLEAICIVVFCVQLKIKNSAIAKLVFWCSRNSLGIYLLQAHPLVWDNFILGKTPYYFRAGEIIWRFLTMLVLLVVGGMLANAVVEKLFTICGFTRIYRKISR